MRKPTNAEETNNIISQSASAMSVDATDSEALKEEKETFEQKRNEEAGEYLDSWNKLFEQNIEERRTFAHWIFVLLCVWLSLIIIIEGCCGLGWLNLTEKVQIALISTTTVDILAIFHSVANYLFKLPEAPPALMSSAIPNRSKSKH
jgi:hypothetical protein